jgi:S1-C subfamily serine protease
MRTRRFSLVLSVTLTAVAAMGEAAYDWTADVERFKPSVVNIERSSEVVLESERQGTSFATGFIVDAERGIIATNRHVTGISPSYVKINFYDGSFTEARVLYYDPVQDFGFYKIDPGDLAFPLQAVELGSWRELKVGEELLLIGNNEREEYSIKYGTVTNLNVNKGDRYGSYLHTTFDRTGGASGSPVWNTRGQVIGIHAAGTETSSFELPIDYLAEALRHLQARTTIVRGETGLDLTLISIGEAVRNYKLPPECAQEIGPSRTGGTPHVIQVEGVIPQTPAVEHLQPGDIVYRAEGQLLRDDLFLFDRILDSRVHQTVALEVYRNGVASVVNLPVFDAEPQKVRLFARFAGGVFHDIRVNLRNAVNLSTNGVFMPLAEEGSSFSRAGYRDRQGNTKVVVTNLNGAPIRNVWDFVRAARDIPNGLHTFVVVRDFNLYDNSEKPKSLTLNLQYGPLEVFQWNEETLEWAPVSLEEVSRHEVHGADGD